MTASSLPISAPRSDGFPRRFAALAVTAAIVALTALGALVAVGNARSQRELRFREMVSLKREDVASRLETYVELLGATAGLFDAERDVTPESFRAFYSALRLHERHPGVQGIGFSERTAAPDGDRHTIRFVEPAAYASTPVFGWDMSSEPTRRAAMDLARDRRRTAASGRILLRATLAGGEATGFNVFAPVYERDRPLDTVAARRAALRGYVYSPVRFDELLAGICPPRADDPIAVALFCDQPTASEAPVAARADWPDSPALTRDAAFVVAGVPWRLRAATRPPFDAHDERPEAFAVVVAGAAALAAWLFFLHRQDRARREVDAAASALAESERALRAGEQRFREITETITEVVWTAGPDGRTTYVSPSYGAVWGRDPGEALARRGAWLESIHEEDRPRVREAFELQRTGAYDVQYRIVRPDGSIRWIRDRGTAVRDASGALVRTIGTAADVTDLVDAREEALRQAEQFRQAQKMEVVGRLAGGVAHDFNNHLTVISGYSSMLAAATPRPAEEVRRFAGEIATAAGRAATLTAQLLAFSRKQMLQPVVLDPSEVVGGLMSMLRRLIGEDVRLAFVPGGPDERVRADRGQLEQVVINLAVNARDAMPNGGRLTVELHSEELDGREMQGAETASPGRYVVISVTDTGIGMDAATRARIFEPFFTTKGPGKGTGLGLSTVYGVVRQSGGYVHVYSEPGRGSSFRIYLPRVAAEASEAPAEGEEPQTCGGTETILLAEDEEALRVLVRNVLVDAGYVVLDGATPDEVLATARRHPGTVDLVLTDTVMPGMSGRDLAERVWASRPDVRVLYMSGYTADAIVRHGVLDPGIEFIAKPFTTRALLRRVRDVLDRRSLAPAAVRTGSR